MNHPDAIVSHDRSVCVTCGVPGTGRFCATCGQRQPAGRHTLRGFAAAAVRRTVGEAGALQTVKLLSLRPGQVVRDNVASRTVHYVHPAAYLLLTVAVFAFAARSLGGATGAGESDRLFTLLIIPFVAAVSRMLFWRDGYNYAEHLIIATYLAAHALLILVPFLWIGSLLPQPTAGLVGGVALLLTAVTSCGDTARFSIRVRDPRRLALSCRYCLGRSCGWHSPLSSSRCCAAESAVIAFAEI